MIITGLILNLMYTALALDTIDYEYYDDYKTNMVEIDGDIKRGYSNY